MTISEEMKAQGWIEHDGGPCPVSSNAMPEVMFEDGGTHPMGWMPAGMWVSARWDGKRPPDYRGNLPKRIIAYRETPNA